MSSLAYMIGMFTGILGICIAIYLEWVIERPCRAKYVYAYLVLGIALTLVSAQDVIDPGILYAKTIGFSIILVLEVYGFFYLYERLKAPYESDISPPEKPYDP